MMMIFSLTLVSILFDDVFANVQLDFVQEIPPIDFVFQEENPDDEFCLYGEPSACPNARGVYPPYVAPVAQCIDRVTTEVDCDQYWRDECPNAERILDRVRLWVHPTTGLSTDVDVAYHPGADQLIPLDPVTHEFVEFTIDPETGFAIVSDSIAVSVTRTFLTLDNCDVPGVIPRYNQCLEYDIQEAVREQCPDLEDFENRFYSFGEPPIDIVDKSSGQVIGNPTCSPEEFFYPDPEPAFLICMYEGWIKPYNNAMFSDDWFLMANDFNPVAVAVDNSGNVYHIESSIFVIKTDSNGNFLKRWGADGQEPDLMNPNFFQGASAIATDIDNNVYVVETLKNRVLKFDSNGMLLTEWGMQGSGDGEFDMPGGIAVESNNQLDKAVYVADKNNHRIQKFDLDGGFLGWMGKCTDAGPDNDGDEEPDENNCDIDNQKSFGFRCSDLSCSGLGPGSNEGQFNNPTRLDIEDLNLWVIDFQNKRLVSIQLIGQESIDSFGGLENPVDLTLDQNTIFVADTEKIFYNKVNLLPNFETFGTIGEGQGEFSELSGIDIDKNQGKLYVVDLDRIQKFDIQFGNNPPIADDLESGVPKDIGGPLTLTGSDPDGDMLSFEIVTPPDMGILTKDLSSNGRTDTSQRYFYKPPLNFEGEKSFEFKTNDGFLDSNTATVTLTVKDFFDVIPLINNLADTIFDHTKKLPAVDILPRNTISVPIKVKLSESASVEPVELTATATSGVFGGVDPLNELDDALELVDLRFSDTNTEKTITNPNPEDTVNLLITFEPNAEFPIGSGEIEIQVKGIGIESESVKTEIFVVRLIGFDLFLDTTETKVHRIIATTDLEGNPFIKLDVLPITGLVERLCCEELAEQEPENVRINLVNPNNLPDGLRVLFLDEPDEPNIICSPEECIVPIDDFWEIDVDYDPSKNVLRGDYSFKMNGRSLKTGTESSTELIITVRENTVLGNGIVVTDKINKGGIDRISLTFPQITKAGETKIMIINDAPSPPNGFRILTSGGDPIVFSIETDSQFVGPVSIDVNYIDDFPGAEQENNFRLQHFNVNSQMWEDITKNIDASDNKISGSTSEFSLFAVMTTIGGGTPIGGELIPIDSDSLVLAGAQMIASWIIPVIVSAVGIGLVFIRKR